MFILIIVLGYTADLGYLMQLSNAKSVIVTPPPPPVATTY